MAAMKVRFVPAGRRTLLNGTEVTDFVGRLGSRVRDRARATAPVMSGTYRDSVQLVVEHTDRARARVLSTVPYAMKVEATHGTLLRALDAASGD